MLPLLLQSDAFETIIIENTVENYFDLFDVIEIPIRPFMIVIAAAGIIAAVGIALREKAKAEVQHF